MIELIRTKMKISRALKGCPQHVQAPKRKLKEERLAAEQNLEEEKRKLEEEKLEVSSFIGNIRDEISEDEKSIQEVVGQVKGVERARQNEDKDLWHQPGRVDGSDGHGRVVCE